jgi:rod shape determining protein RodA
MMRRVNIWASIDWVSVILYLALVFIGLISIYAAVYNEDHSSIFDMSQRYGKQFVFIIAALVIAFSIILIDGKFFSVFAYVIYIATILSLIAVLVFGVEINASRSWFQLGGLGLQPAEFAKVGVSLALAQYLSAPNIKIQSFRVVMRSAMIIFLPVALIMLQPDVGSAIVFFVFLLVLFREGLSFIYLFLALLMAVFFVLSIYLNELNLLLVLIFFLLVTALLIFRSFLVVGFGFGIIGFFAAAVWGLFFLLGKSISWHLILIIAIFISTPIILFLAFRKKIKYVTGLLVFLVGTIVFTSSIDYVFDNVLKPHQQKRIQIMLGIESDPLGYGYNLNQSKIAIGSGGFSGKGFLQGTQTKFNFVPEQTTDFIFCTIGEEWGFLGSFVFIAIFSGLLIRLIFLAERQRSAFSRIYGYSVVVLLFFHMAVNIGMTIGLFPVIGIPLPFISYGGSSLWAFTILLFIFLRLDVSRLEMLK